MRAKEKSTKGIPPGQGIRSCPSLPPDTIIFKVPTVWLFSGPVSMSVIVRVILVIVDADWRSALEGKVLMQGVGRVFVEREVSTQVIGGSQNRGWWKIFFRRLDLVKKQEQRERCDSEA